MSHALYLLYLKQVLSGYVPPNRMGWGRVGGGGLGGGADKLFVVKI